MHLIYLLARGDIAASALATYLFSRLARPYWMRRAKLSPPVSRGRSCESTAVPARAPKNRTHIENAHKFKMGRSRDNDAIKSSLIISEVQKRPCLFDTNDTNYGDRAEKTRCWEEICEVVVPGWTGLGMSEKFTAGTLTGRFADASGAVGPCGARRLREPSSCIGRVRSCVSLFRRPNAFET